jgi:ABC-type glycerol-3-phosphate transport system substrate-binding protein
MRIRAYLSFLLFVVLVAVTGCSPALPTPTRIAVTNEADATPGSATATATSAAVSNISVAPESLRGVTITVWHPWFGPEASTLELQAAEFNSTNEWGITVITIGQDNYSELFNTVSASLAAPDKPNLVIGLPEHALYWDSQSGVADWNPYVTDPKWGWSASDVADFEPLFWNQEVVNGRRVGLPAQRSARFVFYNVTWANELGFKSAPATPDDFRKQACAANQSFRKNNDTHDDGVGGWLVDADPNTAIAWMLAFGGGVSEEQGYRFLRPENIEAFKYVKKLYDDVCAWKGSGDPYEEFASRRALFVSGGLEDISGQMRALGTLGSTDEWAVLPFPGKKSDPFMAYGSSFIMLPSSDAEQLATWLFVRSLLSPEHQQAWVEATGMFPLRNSTLTLLAPYAATHPQWLSAVKLMPEATLPPERADWRQLRVAVGDGFNEMFRVNMDIGQVPTILAYLDSFVRDLGTQ